MKLCGIELHSQASSEGSITMGTALSKKASGLQEARYKSLPMDLELQEIKDYAEKDSMLSKYTKNYNPPLL